MKEVLQVNKNLVTETVTHVGRSSFTQSSNSYCCPKFEGMKPLLFLVGFIFLDLSLHVLATDYRLGLLIPYTNVKKLIANTYFVGKYYAPAITLAVRDINEQTNLLPNDTISFEWRDTNCDEFTTLRHQLQMLERNITAFIGPGCQCKMAAKNAAAFNKTMISYVSIKFT